MNRFWIAMLIAVVAAFPTFADPDCPDDTSCEAQTVADAALDLPAFTPLLPNFDLMWDRDYYRVNDGASLEFYDTPGGALVKTWKAGDNFVTVYEQQGEWGRVGEDRWIRMGQVSKAGVVVSQFGGLQLEATEEPSPHTIAWSLINQYTASEVGGEPLESNPFFYRYSVLTIYETVQDADGYNWYRVGDDAWVHQFRVALSTPVERPEEIETERWVSIDLYEQSLVAYEGDTPVFTTLVSTGLPGWDTNLGTFAVDWMHTRDDMSADHPGDFYYIQEVPWTAFFDEGIALHGTFWHDGFGYPQSHGCVNMSITDAHWIFEFIRPEMDYREASGAAVYVHTTDPAAAS